MPGEIWNIFQKEHSRAQERDVVWHGSENAIVPVATVVMTVPQLAEALAWWPCGKQIHTPEISSVRCDRAPAIAAQEVAGDGDGSRGVVIVDRDGLIPNVVGMQHLESQAAEADPDSTQTGAKFDCNPFVDHRLCA